MAAIQTKEINLSHGKTRYLEAGSGEPLILIHGVSFQAGADDWRPAMQILSAKYRCLAPDMISWPPGDTRENIQAFPQLTDFVREFQDALGIKKAHVCGATMGGWIAGLYAYESPERCLTAILTGNPGFHGAPNDRLANWSLPADDTFRNPVARQMPGASDAEVDAIVAEKVKRRTRRAMRTPSPRP
jgi:pimeloyl-ACP methyl ester carboxylesterase